MSHEAGTDQRGHVHRFGSWQQDRLELCGPLVVELQRKLRELTNHLEVAGEERLAVDLDILIDDYILLTAQIQNRMTQRGVPIRREPPNIAEAAVVYLKLTGQETE
jgi:hypothetical protein